MGWCDDLMTMVEGHHQTVLFWHIPYPWLYLVGDNGCHKIKVAVPLQGHSLPYKYERKKLHKETAEKCFVSCLQ